MQPTDSINSYHYTLHEVEVGAEDGFELGSGLANLPEDVLEALKDDNLELAMFLLNKHKGEGSDLETGFGCTINNLMKKLMRAMSFNFRVAKPAKKKAKKVQKNQKSAKTPVVKKLVKVLVNGTMKLIGIPGKVMVRVVNLGKRVVVKLTDIVMHNVVKPVIAPFVKVATVVVEKYQAIEEFISEKFEKITEKVKDLKEKVAEKVEKFVEEVHEIAKPVRLWLSNKFKDFADKQKWMKAALGQQFQNVIKVADYSINMIAFVVVPLVFCGKQMGKGLKLLKEGFAKHGKKFLRFGNWVKGYLAKGVESLNGVISAITGAIERILNMIFNWILSLLMKLWNLVMKVVSVVMKLLNWLKERIVKSITHYLSN
ncbi:MAG: hypothetical protein K940chlam3_00485 [Chlamydiae bacterium]|nr:hypothetical protein [Chlamydiota bacterium]